MMKIQRAREVTSWTAKDFLDHWHKSWLKHHNTAYQTHGYLGNELSLIKQLIDNSDSYTLAGAMISAIEDGVDSVLRFSSVYPNYINDIIDPKVLYAILKRGTITQKRQLSKLELMSVRWFPSAEDIMNQDKLKQSLKDWADIHG